MKFTTATAAIVLCSISASNALMAGFGTFFSANSCPPGWAEIPDFKGRLIVSVNDSASVGLTSGKPLADREDRAHTHGFKGSFVLPSKHIAADGCCDDDAAAAGKFAFSGESESATSGLPFVQLPFCVLQGTGDNSSLSLPFGALGYFTSDSEACPSSYTPFDDAQGRAIVPGWPQAGRFISPNPPLESQKQPLHQHLYSASSTVSATKTMHQRLGTQALYFKF